MGLFIVWLILCFIVGAVGTNKKVGYWGTFFLSLILSPLIGLIIALVSSNKAPQVITYKCKQCGFSTTVNSHFCPACGKDDKGLKVEDYQNTQSTN